MRPSLIEAKATILGVGGTGSAVATGLVAYGISHLHVVDFDHVEESNLTRQLLFTEKDIGTLKCDAAVSRLRAINPELKVTGENRKICGPGEIVALMGGCDVFVLCADVPVKKVPYWANTAALQTKTPWFMAVYEGPTIAVASFHPGVTGCWACLRREQDSAEFVAEGRPLFAWPPTAVISASANVAGQLCALEMTRYLTTSLTQVLGRVYRYNLAHWENNYFIDVPRFHDCPSCAASSVPALSA